MYFVGIWEQTAIISLYSIDWLDLYNQDVDGLTRGISLMFEYNSGQLSY